MAGILDPSVIKQFKDMPLKEVERRLLESLNCFEDWNSVIGKPFISEVMPELGYKDEPGADEEGKPILRRTTPLHLLARRDVPIDYPHLAVRSLFEIYNKFDRNYIDEFGLTHFHVACRYGCEDVVQKFLDLGQDPNLLVREIDDSPLLLALNWQHKEVAELLLRRGADPNLPNKNGLTPLHVICQVEGGGGLIKFFFNINDELNQTVPVNAQDKFGNTPLHFALFNGNTKKIELLLRRGADSNLRNAAESTPLHIICHGSNNYELAKVFFGINKELGRTVQLDVADKLGRTPLQLAVANILPNTVDVLLSNGADPSSFVFPADSYFVEKFKPLGHGMRINFKLRLASGALLIVERLERSGYELDRSDALAIMKFFAKRGLFEKSVDLQKRLSDDEQFAVQAKQIMVKSDLSLFELIKLSPKEAKKQLTYTDYFKFTSGIQLWNLSEGPREACLVHMCEKLSRDFFQSWTMDPFMELTHYRLPLLCCDMIFEHLNNEDLLNICMAAIRESS